MHKVNNITFCHCLFSYRYTVWHHTSSHISCHTAMREVKMLTVEVYFANFGWKNMVSNVLNNRRKAGWFVPWWFYAVVVRDRRDPSGNNYKQNGGTSCKKSRGSAIFMWKLSITLTKKVAKIGLGLTSYQRPFSLNNRRSGHGRGENWLIEAVWFRFNQCTGPVVW